MKTFAFLPFQSPMMILVIFASSCDNGDDQPTTAELLIGTWTTSTIVIDATVGTQSVTDYLINEVGLSPADAAAQYALFEAALQSEVTGSLTLNTDNTYASSFGGGSDSGTWSLSSDEKPLTLYEGADVIVITINSVSSSTLNATLGDDIAQDLDADTGTPDEIVTVEATITLTK